MRFDIRECGVDEWKKFRRYHYLNTDILRGAKCYGLYNEKNQIIAFRAVIHQPHGINKRLKRGHRLVVLPDYQGIGIGTRFTTAIAKKYHDEGWDFDIVTSAKNLIFALNRNRHWKLIFLGRRNCGSEKCKIDRNRKSMRNKCTTASFRYIG